MRMEKNILPIFKNTYVMLFLHKNNNLTHWDCTTDPCVVLLLLEMESCTFLLFLSNVIVLINLHNRRSFMLFNQFQFRRQQFNQDFGKKVTLKLLFNN